MLRLGGVAAEHVNAGCLAAAHIFHADEHLFWIIGGDQRRKHRDQHERADEDQPDLTRAAAKQALPSPPPERDGLAEQPFVANAGRNFVRCAPKQTHGSPQLWRMRGSR